MCPQSENLSLLHLQTLEQSCEAIQPCAEVEPLNHEELLFLLRQLPQYWKTQEKDGDVWLVCTLDNEFFGKEACSDFYDYLFALFAKIREIVVQLDHHPRIELAYHYIAISVITHAFNPKSLTVNDFILAHEVSRIVEESKFKMEL